MPAITGKGPSAPHISRSIDRLTAAFSQRSPATIRARDEKPAAPQARDRMTIASANLALERRENLLSLSGLSPLAATCLTLGLARFQAIMVFSLEAPPERFLPFLPFRKETSISVPLTRTSSQRR